MRKGLVALALLFALTLLNVAPAEAATSVGRKAARVRSAIAALGSGPDAQIDVRLSGGGAVNGYVSSADDTGFTVAAPSGAQQRILYGGVKALKGRNAFTGQSVVITAAVIAGILLIVLVALAHDN